MLTTPMASARRAALDISIFGFASSTATFISTVRSCPGHMTRRKCCQLVERVTEIERGHPGSRRLSRTGVVMDDA
jgi:hypothetical protein